jgi:DNA mismatch repair protein mutS
MISLKNSIRYLPELKRELSIVKSDYLKEIYLKLETLEDIYSIIDEMIVEEPPITITEGRSYQRRI